MKRMVLMLVVLGVAGLPAMAQADYPADVLEKYYDCMERNDLDFIKELLYYHHNVERIDALKEKGIRAYIKKPFKPEEFRDVVSDVLGAFGGEDGS